MNNQHYQGGKPSLFSTPQDLVRSALVIALYVATTLLLLPWSFGPIQLRLSEMLNFLGLYHPRYKYAITLAVFIANFAQYGPIDMVVGSLTTLVSFWMAIKVGDWIIKLWQAYRPIPFNPILVKYGTLVFFFAFNCFTIALMISYLTVDVAFWPTYASLFFSEGTVMLLGAFVFYPISQRLNFYQ
ncbi:QueT transporter family protein [Vaginisenegalia massiliensis]|uniref:QueT transporter family protein n=1 Tax=Vaginisenegalia massiliensis TaxID=2058294 RepID=UPI000F544D0D|nr:QueT transporter family protein [Vaginisenegalia massiliensis]